MLLWVRKILSKICKNKKTLLIIDSATSHLNESVQTAIKSLCSCAVIPGGMTALLQYLDRYSFGKYKAFLHTQLEEAKATARDASAASRRKLSDRFYRETFSNIIPTLWKNHIETDTNAAEKMAQLGYCLPVCGIDDHKPNLPNFPDVKFNVLALPPRRHKWLKALLLDTPTPALTLLVKSGADLRPKKTAVKKGKHAKRHCKKCSKRRPASAHK